MGESTQISWCDHTFNPWIGCSKVSPACEHCYAEREFRRKPQWADCWGPEGQRRRTGAAYWRKPLSWEKQAQLEGRRYRVFCGSLCDVFEDREELATWRDELFTLVAQCKSLDWLFLTKRTDVMLDYFGTDTYNFLPGGCFDHLWLGVTAENQELADKRIPYLIKINAPVRFISAEPLLGKIDLLQSGVRISYGPPTGDPPMQEMKMNIDWVICGGESGPQSRSTNPEWIRRLRDDCKKLKIAFHFKQWGESMPYREACFQNIVFPWGPISYPFGWPGNAMRPAMVRVGKKNAGCMIDGETHNEFPEVIGNFPKIHRLMA